MSFSFPLLTLNVPLWVHVPQDSWEPMALVIKTGMETCVTFSAFSRINQNNRRELLHALFVFYRLNEVLRWMVVLKYLQRP